LKVWQPPQSPLRVEYPEELLSHLQPDPARIETVGLLYGSRSASAVRLTATSPTAEAGDVVGIYVLRTHGEVFLSEANTALFEQSHAAVGLVVAGNKAGFFVRAIDGSLQSVRSFEEFYVPRAGPRCGSTLRNQWALTAALLLAALLPLIAVVWFQPAGSPRRAGLSIRQDGDQLLISWRSGRAGLLEISDGGHRTSARILPQQSAATYMRRYGDVKVTLILLNP